MSTQPSQERLVGAVLQLQAQRLSTIDERTRKALAAIEELTEHLRQLSRAQAQLSQEIHALERTPT